MARVELLNNNTLKNNLADVLYLNNQGEMPLEIEQLLQQKKITFRNISFDNFSEISDRLELIGTAIIDTQNTTDSAQIINIAEILEGKNIDVILLTGKSDSKAGITITNEKSELSFGNDSRSVAIDDLEARISVNLARRSKGSNAKKKDVIQKRQSQPIVRNKLAEQLNMTKTLAENLSEQLRLAGLVQQDFLPSHLPDSERLQWATTFMPVEWVSGDIYDVTRLDEEHIGFYIADVVGHGMPAALLTIFLKQALVMRQTEGSNYRILSPSEVMKNLNLRMSAQKLSGYQFATCCYCLLNTTTLTLTYARAGHPYPILIRKGKSPEQLEIRGSLLGIFEQAEFPQRTIQLQQGDKLVMYSDGVDSFVGNFNNKAGFNYRREFLEVSNMQLVDMIESLDALIQTSEIRESEMDDITIVGLEILQ